MDGKDKKKSKNRGHDNLIPLNRRSKADQRRIQKMGTKAAVKARRRRADLRKALESILIMQCGDKEIREELESVGIEPTYENALTVSVLQRGISRGDPQAYRTIAHVLGTSLDDKEQEARIARLEADADRIRNEVARRDGTAGRDHAGAQVAAIADMINNPQADRILDEFLHPPPDNSGDGEEVDDE